MSEPTDRTEPSAVVARRRGVSTLWIVPIVAALVGLWMVYYDWSHRGPTLRVSFNTAEGIEAGKTRVRMKNVEIGQVVDLRLADDASGVILTIQAEQHAAHLIRDDSEFWVVRPRVGSGGISGLSTLLSGAYVELSPGKSETRGTKFVGLDSPPVTPIGTPGLHITLESAGEENLSTGDPVLFHGMEVGSIEYVHFNTAERKTYYDAFIVEPFNQLVTDNTRFWFSGGIGLDLSADGVQLEIASVTALLAGGVSFDIPASVLPGEKITERTFFPIYPNKRAINRKQHKHSLKYVIFFDDSIRRLRVGAPVEFRGAVVGRILRTDADYPQITNLLEPSSRIPVVFEIIPALMGFPDTEQGKDTAEQRLRELVKTGLRGGMEFSSLITGQKYLELQYSTDHLDVLDQFNGYVVVPAINDQFGQLLVGVENTLASITDLPLTDLVQSATNALTAASSTLGELELSATELQGILADEEMHHLVGNLNNTLADMQGLAVDFSSGSTTHREMQQALQSLEAALRAPGV